jgi:multidrug efflux pump subunit AcrA (membrane-fusion protein)
MTSSARASVWKSGGRRALVATVATGLLLAGLLAARGVRGAGAPGEKPAAGPAAAQEVLGVGTLESVREVPAAFEAQGKIASLLVDEGDTVRATAA